MQCVRARVLTLAAVLSVAAAVLGQAAKAPVTIQDVFGRDLTTVGITLVDWEGPIANPAARLAVAPALRLYVPSRVTLRTDSPLLQFNLFSELGPEGATKTLFLEQKGKPAEFLMSALPTAAGDYLLTVAVDDANEHHVELEIPIHVVTMKRARTADSPAPLKITVDYSHDPSDLFEDAKCRRIFEQAASAWEYYLADPGFDEVEAGSEKSWIFDLGGFESGHEVTNANRYKGYLLYAQGIEGPEARSTGAASMAGGRQTVGGRRTGLRRSGTVAMEITGNYNRMGWQMLNADEDYWRASNQSDVLHDFYSIARHEMGHALAFHRVHPAFSALISGGVLHDADVTRYLGREPSVNDSEHFYDTIDPVSRVGAFGNEYGGDFPRKRWLLTKFDLLVAKAVGYALQDTAPFWPLAMEMPEEPVSLVLGEPAVIGVRAVGGIPAYRFSVKSGSLPSGLKLDSFTGRIEGTPREAGEFEVELELRDNDPAEPVVLGAVKLVVKGP
jgi:hypothetical protein